MYIFRPLSVIGMIEECDILQFFGFSVVHFTLPVSRSTPTISAPGPPGAMTATAPSISGHWAVYQSGTFVPYSLQRSMPHFRSPVTASTHITWQRGPIVTTYLSLTAGTVRDIPWLRSTRTL